MQMLSSITFCVSPSPLSIQFYSGDPTVRPRLSHPLNSEAEAVRLLGKQVASRSKMWFLRFLFLCAALMIGVTIPEVRSNRLASMASGVLGRWADVADRPRPRPQPEPEPEFQPQPSRSHFRENANLLPLTEEELETLVFLLNKVRPQVREQAEGLQFPLHPQQLHERRSKRTGQHGQPHKKSVDWSNYFGIDKRSVPASVSSPSLPNAAAAAAAAAAAEHIPKVKGQDEPKHKDLKSFYKSMAMAGNMKKRKRSVGGLVGGETNELELEEKMKSAGDKLIWDALKLTGSRKDEKLSKEELGALKKKLIEEISAAYNLEKLRQFLKKTTGQ